MVIADWQRPLCSKHQRGLWLVGRTQPAPGNMESPLVPNHNHWWLVVPQRGSRVGGGGGAKTSRPSAVRAFGAGGEVAALIVE